MTQPPPTLLVPSPGTYLRKRREAAGVNLDLAALAFVPWSTPGDIAARIGGEQITGRSFDPAVRLAADNDLIGMVRTIAARIAELEADQRHVDRTITGCLARIVPIDVEIYDALVALQFGVNVPLPQVCRQCACSWHRPCIEHGVAPCAWSATDPNLCTACESKAAATSSENTAEKGSEDAS